MTGHRSTHLREHPSVQTHEQEVERARYVGDRADRFDRCRDDAPGVFVGRANDPRKNLPLLLKRAKKLTKYDSSGNLTRIGFDPKIDSGYGFPLWVKYFGKDIISKDGLILTNNPDHIHAARDRLQQRAPAVGNTLNHAKSSQNPVRTPLRFRLRHGTSA